MNIQVRHTNSKNNFQYFPLNVVTHSSLLFVRSYSIAIGILRELRTSILKRVNFKVWTDIWSRSMQGIGKMSKRFVVDMPLLSSLFRQSSRSYGRSCFQGGEGNLAFCFGTGFRAREITTFGRDIFFLRSQITAPGMWTTMSVCSVTNQVDQWQASPISKTDRIISIIWLAYIVVAFTFSPVTSSFMQHYISNSAFSSKWIWI